MLSPGCDLEADPDHQRDDSGDNSGAHKKLRAQPERRFAHRLAIAFGRWDVDEFLSEIPAAVFAEWQAYDSLEPIDAAGAILRGLSGGDRKEPPAAEKRQQTWEDHYAFMSQFAVKKA